MSDGKENRWIATVESDDRAVGLARRGDVDRVESIHEPLGLYSVIGSIGKHRPEHLCGVGRVERDTKGTHC